MAIASHADTLPAQVVRAPRGMVEMKVDVSLVLFINRFDIAGYGK